MGVLMIKELQLAIDREKELKRSARYFERFDRVEGNLARIRAKLGVTHKNTDVTLQRIDDLQEAAYNWFALRGELNDVDTN